MIMKKVLFIMAVSAMAAGCADNSIPKAQLPELDLSNPLLAAWDTPHETPPFSEIKLADYEPRSMPRSPARAPRSTRS